MLVVDGCGEAHEVRDTRRIGEVPDVGIELVPFEVIAQRGTPVGQQLQHVGSREINLLLLIAVVHGQLCRVTIHVVGVIIGILRQPAGGKLVADALIIRRLEERVQILLPFPSFPHIIHDGPRDATGGVIEITLHLPAALPQTAIEIRLDTFGVDITVLTHRRRVPGRRAVRITALIVELILSAGRQESGTHATAHRLRDPLLPQPRQPKHITTPILRPEPQMNILTPDS